MPPGTLAGVRARVLHTVARLIRELAEVDFPAVEDSANIRMLAPAEKTLSLALESTTVRTSGC